MCNNTSFSLNSVILSELELQFGRCCTSYSFSFISLATLSVNLASGTSAGFCGAELLCLNQSVNASWASCRTTKGHIQINARQRLQSLNTTRRRGLLTDQVSSDAQVFSDGVLVLGGQRRGLTDPRPLAVNLPH